MIGKGVPENQLGLVYRPDGTLYYGPDGTALKGFGAVVCAMQETAPSPVAAACLYI